MKKITKKDLNMERKRIASLEDYNASSIESQFTVKCTAQGETCGICNSLVDDCKSDDNCNIKTYICPRTYAADTCDVSKSLAEICCEPDTKHIHCGLDKPSVAVCEITDSDCPTQDYDCPVTVETAADGCQLPVLTLEDGCEPVRN